MIRLVSALFTVIFASFIFYLLSFVVAVASTEFECLEKGYPSYRVAYNFNSYCMNMEGTVTIRVDKL